MEAAEVEAAGSFARAGGELPPPAQPPQAAAAEAEGFLLLLSSNNATGYKGVKPISYTQLTQPKSDQV